MEAATCVIDGTEDCTENSDMLDIATSHYLRNDAQPSPSLVGRFTLQDGTPCGTSNEFFGVHVWATATLLDSSNNALATPARVDEFGDYFVPSLADAASVKLTCENAATVTAPW